MKKNIKSCFVLILLICILTQLCCQFKLSRVKVDRFQYDHWMTSVYQQFDSLNQGSGVSTYFPNLRNEIAYVNESDFLFLLDSVTNMNTVEDWYKMQYMYHHSSGEVNVSLSTFIFSSKNKEWGMSFMHNTLAFYPVKIEYCAFLDSVRSSVYYHDDLIFISEFNRKYEINNNIMMIGCFSTSEYDKLLRIYDFTF
jgi:hypothetical protein